MSTHPLDTRDIEPWSHTGFVSSGNVGIQWSQYIGQIMVADLSPFWANTGQCRAKLGRIANSECSEGVSTLRRCVGKSRNASFNWDSRVRVSVNGCIVCTITVIAAPQEGENVGKKVFVQETGCVLCGLWRHRGTYFPLKHLNSYYLCDNDRSL